MNDNVHPFYHCKDHLGNVRVSYADTSGDGLVTSSEVIETVDYYPFGLQKDYTANVVTSSNLGQKLKYQGQERQDDLDLKWDSFKWRNYDYVIGRFISVDPLAEKYVDWGSYVFSGNRVIDARELEGLEPAILYGSKQEAVENFGQQYNGLSIMLSREMGTIFYSQSTANGTKYSYITPRMGAAAGVMRNQEDVALIPDGATAITGGHTHGGAPEDGSGTFFNHFTKKFEDSSSSFSSNDIQYSENFMKNAFGTPMPEIMIGPDGGQREYDPAKYESQNSSKANVPINRSMPSDPNTGKARLNSVSPRVLPQVLPRDYNPKATSLKKPYSDLQPALEQMFK